ncbi:hypothetical protein QNH05_gp07 [Escherichia phage vB_EcoM_DE15]|uniref:Uncharacterized protein n=1 Tax=Escherichia phage vB_EcoM_DE15 TaxID=3003366 RepID=A0AAE9VNM8_9CAUD|nr:hypothetical protein QNH05_gp07 [Escherichia phage vB_EcoM_DE15]WAX24522.1 hypothetical protein [Escherichia phage vB_EcoM_DE15]
MKSKILKSAMYNLHFGLSYPTVKRQEKRFSRLPARTVAKEVKKASEILKFVMWKRVVLTPETK